MLGPRPRTFRKAARQIRAQRIKRWECHLNYPADLAFATLAEWTRRTRLQLLQSMHVALYERPADTTRVMWLVTAPILPDALLNPLREMVADLVDVVVPAGERRDVVIAERVGIRRSELPVMNGIFTVTVAEVEVKR